MMNSDQRLNRFESRPETNPSIYISHHNQLIAVVISGDYGEIHRTIYSKEPFSLFLRRTSYDSRIRESLVRYENQQMRNALAQFFKELY